MALEDSLARIPGLAGYLAQNQINDKQLTDQLGQYGSMLQLQNAVRAQQQEQGFRSGMEALGPSPTPEALAGVAAKYASPKDVLAREQASADRKAQLSVMRETAAARLDQAKQSADMVHEFRMGRLSDEQSRQVETARHNKAMEEIGNQYKALGLEMRSQGLELRKQQFDNTQEQQLQNQTTHFANTLQQNKVPQLASSMGAANDLLKKYENDSIPGFGAVSGSSAIPNLLRSEDAKNVRSAVQGVTNDLLNMYSGLAVTLPESERRSLEQMNRGDFTEADFRNAWPRVVSRFNSVMGSLKAGANPKAVEKYQSQAGAIKLEPITPAFQKSETTGGWSIKEK